MGFLGGLQIQHWTDLLCASCGIKHQTRLGWVRVAECISVHACVYPVSFQPVKRKSAVRSLRRWPWKDMCAETHNSLIIREKILLFSASRPDGPFSDMGSQMREMMFWFSANELPPMLQPV